MQKSDKVLAKFRVILHFMIAQCGHNFHFKISRSPARHLAVTDIAMTDDKF